MIDTEPFAAATRAALLCTCGAARTPCPDCAGTGRQPDTAAPAACPSCRGLGASQSHDWCCACCHPELLPADPAGRQDAPFS
ncbi:hypothetical protein [Kitasatospora terrestris]|uniref:Uncharacterized protein n=1 Tax=Kitasatospora terrestris TaxID=258051 RepID=A0ABP9DL14_9ACTN